MESTNPTILKFSISKLTFLIQNDKKEQLTLGIEKKINCRLGKAKQKDKIYITFEIIARSVPEGAFEFSAECKAILATIAQDISDDELKEQIEKVYVPLVDQMAVDKIKKITTEMGQSPLDLATNQPDESSK